MDRYFRESGGPKIILNDVDYYDFELMKSIDNKIMTVYEEPIISYLPTCDCGTEYKRYMLGTTCGTCGSEVSDPHKKVEPILWMHSLSSDLPFLNPLFINSLRHIIGHKFDVVRWLMDNRYNPPVKHPDYLQGLREVVNGDRTYITFLNKLEAIIIYLKNVPSFVATGRTKDLELLQQELVDPNSGVFSKYLPIINKKLFVMEHTSKGNFTDVLAVSEVLDVVKHWVKITSDDNLTKQQASRTMSTVTVNMCNLALKYYEKFLYDKLGIYRKHLYGARLHFTFRTVLTSITERHRYDEVHVPWSIGVVVFRLHLLNKLRKRGYNYKDSSALLYRAVKVYVPIIDTLLQELIDESPHEKGIPIIGSRNPGLLQGSILVFFISKFKTDVRDKTTAASPLSAKPGNADYDGDQLNYLLLLDNYMAELVKTLQIHHSVPGTSEPYDISGLLTMDSSADAIINNYLADQAPKAETDSLQQLLLKETT